MGFDGLWWMSMGFDGFWWILMDFDGFWCVLRGFDGFWWIPVDFDEFRWILLDFIELRSKFERKSVEILITSRCKNVTKLRSKIPLTWCKNATKVARKRRQNAEKKPQKSRKNVAIFWSNRDSFRHLPKIRFINISLYARIFDKQENESRLLQKIATFLRLFCYFLATFRPFFGHFCSVFGQFLNQFLIHFLFHFLIIFRDIFERILIASAHEDFAQQVPTKSIKIHQNPSKSIETHRNPSKSIKIDQHRPKPIKTHQKPSQPIKIQHTANYQNPSRNGSNFRVIHGAIDYSK